MIRTRISVATGKYLDMLATLVSETIRRKEGEGDESFRKRLIDFLMTIDNRGRK